jgi:hypothetical protein
VSEHRIRLRGGWECCASAPRTDVAERRLNLPIRWSQEDPLRLRLTRRFGRPAFDPSCQKLVLELDQVAGIDSLFLNGQPIAAVSPERTHYEIALDRALERNTLVLEIQRPAAGQGEPATAPEWGVIALVIRSID